MWFPFCCEMIVYQGCELSKDPKDITLKTYLKTYKAAQSAVSSLLC